MVDDVFHSQHNNKTVLEDDTINIVIVGFSIDVGKIKSLDILLAR